ncbi:hypothetical protein SAMN06265349_101714 [Flavobacterium resistens]|uniref:Uncharacterized protein n=1 Tax=Flavobacterium resistens TaxID=443612 RepID=A0A521B5V3_9FLAO|nr:hypothetical protein [Flavobacterium resistens]MRX70284.1 hypothetical protein [Flavobacterium resistens]SMO42445.1 hypothetical protein SAMN06265349_101714 [Flavobacterium resistens]
MTRKERLTQRNNQVRKLFYDLQAKNPKWRIDAIIEEVGNKTFLANRTVEAIINYEGIYNDNAKPVETSQISLFQFI